MALPIGSLNFLASLPPSTQGLTLVHFRLNVSTFCWIRWVHDFPPVY